MLIKECINQDVPQLALMNKYLIEDETILGYALIRHTSTPPYLRQFYIERDFRRKHHGKQAFYQLMEYIQADTIDIDVLPWNERGHSFWKSCGFDDTCISMRYKK